MKEFSRLEFKKSLSKTFLKTVSAFANYGTGIILFGVDDEGVPVGVADPTEVRLTIENAINDALDPRPNYYIEEETKEGKHLVKLTVYEGEDKPYLCSGKAYQRFDTSTVAVDRSELRRLSIEGSDKPFDEMAASSQELTFASLGKSLNERMGIEEATEETLKTLGLLKDRSFTNAALLLSDQNTFPGLEIVRYALDEVSIHQRITCEGVSVLDQLDAAVAEYRNHYVVERVNGMRRNEVHTIPEEAFREAVANSLVHRLWYANARTTVSLYPTRIEVASPGGLPAGIDEELYLSGGISLPRNASLAYVFLRLGIIERLGTGIRRIRRAYEGSAVGPTFQISAHAITVTLPLVNLSENLEPEEQKMLALFRPGLELSGAELEQGMGLSRATTMRIVAALREKGALQRIGNARATRYRLP